MSTCLGCTLGLDKGEINRITDHRSFVFSTSFVFFLTLHISLASDKLSNYILTSGNWFCTVLIETKHSLFQEIVEAATRILKLPPHLQPVIEVVQFEFDPATRCVSFVPALYENAGWKVESIKRPAVVCTYANVCF